MQCLLAPSVHSPSAVSSSPQLVHGGMALGLNHSYQQLKQGLISHLLMEEVKEVSVS